MEVKILAAVGKLLKDFKDLSARVGRLEKVKPAVVNGRDGKDGRDGVNPSVEDVVSAVVKQLPEPEKINTKAIVDEVVAKIPKPRDGRDAQQVNVSDVAAIVLAKIPKPEDGKDGRNGPDLETVVKRVKAQVRDGEQGEQGPPGPRGAPGKDGVSVTDVQLNGNDLFVFLDGVKKKAGAIKIPAITAPFNPGNVGGGGSARAAVKPLVGFQAFSDDSISIPTDPDNPAFITGYAFNGSGFELFDANTGAVKNISDRVLKVSGTISYNPTKGGGGVALAHIFSESSTDNGATWQLNQGSNRPVEIGNVGESFKTSVSFLDPWNPDQLVRFRIFFEGPGTLDIDPSSTTTLGEVLTGHSVVWELSEVFNGG